MATKSWQGRSRGAGLRRSERGLSRKGKRAAEARHYYSFTRMATTGTVHLDGQRIAVTGVSWMDKELGSNQLGKDTIGWDWFCLQLDAGRELMLCLLRTRNRDNGYAPPPW